MWPTSSTRPCRPTCATTSPGGPSWPVPPAGSAWRRWSTGPWPGWSQAAPWCWSWPRTRRPGWPIGRCWPGPLTLVLPRHPGLAADLGDDELTVGVRMSAHPVLLTLCRIVGPLGVATAGIQGERELETAEEVAETFGAAVPIVLDG